MWRNNPEDAVFCRNCGTRLREEVKKSTVIETENINRNNTQGPQTTVHTHTNTNTNTGSNSSSPMIGCAVAVVCLQFL